jgi:ribosome biogenesis GTPase A
MDNFWKLVNSVIRKSDVLLLILDARFAYETRNEEVENKVRATKKPLIYVITKSDLSSPEVLKECKKRMRPSVFVSAKERQGSGLLRERILIESDRVYGKRDTITVGVLGYPNVGKSSLINMLKGRHSLSTSSLSGHTKALQKVRAGRNLYFIDTPGVIPYMEKDELKHALIGVKDYTKVKDPDLIVLGIMRRLPGKLEAFYGVPENEDKEKTLEHIALKRNVLKKGGFPDVMRMAREIIRDFQKGKIK